MNEMEKENFNNLVNRLLAYEISWTVATKLERKEIEITKNGRHYYIRCFSTIIRSLYEALSNSGCCLYFEEYLTFFRKLSDSELENNFSTNMLANCWLKKLSEGSKEKVFDDYDITYSQLEILFFEDELGKIENFELEEKIQEIKKEKGYIELLNLNTF